jgi:hypothetical protein
MIIATEIRNQLYHFGKQIVWSWGAHSWTGGEDFLEFQVQGFKLKGYVRITLNGLDLYDISFKNSNREVIKEIKDVYAEDMVDIIDNEVETDNGKYLI